MKDEFQFIDDNIEEQRRRVNLIEELKEMESASYQNDNGYTSDMFLASSFLKDKKEKKKKKNDILPDTFDSNYEPDDTFYDILYSKKDMFGKKKRRKNKDIFDTSYDHKKKKKKKDKNGLVDYKKEFEPEIALYKNLLIQQNNFTDSLQKEYDSIKSAKSSSRGVTKQMSDLIENINDARSLSMQLVEKHVNAKKLVADLSMKQKEKFMKLDDTAENLADYASSYLKKMLSERGSIIETTNGDISVTEYNDVDVDLFDDMDLSSNGDIEERPDEISKYLKYENKNVTVYAIITENDVEDFDFMAKSADGEIIDDYPLPIKTSLSINRSTMIATDTLGKKYPIIFR